MRRDLRDRTHCLRQPIPRLELEPQTGAQVAEHGFGVGAKTGGLDHPIVETETTAEIHLLLEVGPARPRQRKDLVVEQGVVVFYRPGQIVTHGGLAVEDLAEQHHRSGQLLTADLAQHPAVAAPWVKAEVEEAAVETGPAAGDT